MKLLRYGGVGAEKPGILGGPGIIRDLSGHVADIDGNFLTNRALDEVSDLDLNCLPMVERSVRIGACVANVGKFICIGLNYSDHTAESGMEVPEEPVIFMKATSAICGPNDDVVIPRGSCHCDWEVELGVVIGTEARYVDEADALSHVAGYCIENDLSDREFQLERSGQWVKGKSADTFGPIRPWLVTRDEVMDPQNLSLWLEVNGHRHQQGNTNTMIFGVARLVSYVSQFMSLQAGDIISTGAPPGVGFGLKPPSYLKSGDRIRVGVEGIGEQNQSVLTWSVDQPLTDRILKQEII